MPTADNHIKVYYDDEDFRILKLAATLGQYQNLRAYCTQVLLAHARRIVTEFQSQKPSSPSPTSEGSES